MHAVDAHYNSALRETTWHEMTNTKRGVNALWKHSEYAVQMRGTMQYSDHPDPPITPLATLLWPRGKPALTR